MRTADADRGHRRIEGSGSISGYRRLQTRGGSGATGSRHGRSRCLGNERSRRVGPGSVDAFFRKGDRTGTRLAASGDGATFRLQPGRPGATIRSQRELGLSPISSCGTASRNRAAARPRRRDLGACRHEVSGAGGARQPQGLPAHGRCVFEVPLQQPPSRRTLRGLARRLHVDTPADSGFSRTVFKSAPTGFAAAAISSR